MLGEDAHQVGPLVEGVALERAEADVAVAQAGEHGRTRGAGLVVPLQGLAGLDQGEGAAGRHAQRLQHLGRQHLAHAALERQAAIAEARIGRLARALGPEVEQPIRAGLAQLGVEEAAAVAEVWVVGAELVAVVAHGQGLGLVSRQRLEPGEGGDPFGVVEGVEPHGGGDAVIAETHEGLREDRGAHRVGELGAEGGETRIGAVGGGNRHAFPYPLIRQPQAWPILWEHVSPEGAPTSAGVSPCPAGRPSNSSRPKPPRA